jgi:peptide/nickel transport system ATP-binding protein
MTLTIEHHGPPLLSVRDFHVQFDTDEGAVHAVNGVSFDVHRGEVFAIVGESGSGKSVTAMSLLGLIPTANVTGGEARWKEIDLLGAAPDAMRRIRGGEIAMIFQDPLTALNPVHKVGRQIGEMLRIHRDASRSEARARAVELLDLVGIPQARKRVDSYPHEFSGGMRQRAMIAMAIACEPDLLIADEPTTALDVTVQAQVLEILMELKERINSAIVLITHDLGVVAGKADRVMVMYAGRGVEIGTTGDIFYGTSHPYTLGLLASLPRVDDTGTERLRPITGAPPSLISIPSGCPFHPRCGFARRPTPCESNEPALTPVTDGSHRAACHFAHEVREASPAASREEIIQL